MTRMQSSTMYRDVSSFANSQHLSSDHPSPNVLPVDYDPTQPICSNCGTQTTPLWRRSEAHTVLCNACSLYAKMKGCPRPVTLKSNVIKHRNRSKGSKKDKEAAIDAAAILMCAAGSGDYPVPVVSPSKAANRRGQSRSRTRAEERHSPYSNASPANGFSPSHSGSDDSEAPKHAPKRQKRPSSVLDEKPDVLSLLRTEITDLPQQIIVNGSRSRSTSADPALKGRSTQRLPRNALAYRSPSQPSTLSREAHHQYETPNSVGQFGAPYLRPSVNEHFPSDAVERGTRLSRVASQDSTVPSVGDTPSAMDEEFRGRQRDRFTLPPIQSFDANSTSAATARHNALRLTDKATSSPSLAAYHITASPPTAPVPIYAGTIGSSASVAHSASGSRFPSTVTVSPAQRSQSPQQEGLDNQYRTFGHDFWPTSPSTMASKPESPESILSQVSGGNDHANPGATELALLRARVAELELINSFLHSRVSELEGQQDAPARNGMGYGGKMSMDEE